MFILLAVCPCNINSVSQQCSSVEIVKVELNLAVGEAKQCCTTSQIWAAQSRSQFTFNVCGIVKGQRSMFLFAAADHLWCRFQLRAKGAAWLYISNWGVSGKLLPIGRRKKERGYLKHPPPHTHTCTHTTRTHSVKTKYSGIQTLHLWYSNILFLSVAQCWQISSLLHGQCCHWAQVFLSVGMENPEHNLRRRMESV